MPADESRGNRHRLQSWGAAARVQQGRSTPGPLGFFRVKLLIRFGKEFFDAFAVASVNSHAGSSDAAGRAIDSQQRFKDTEAVC